MPSSLAQLKKTQDLELRCANQRCRDYLRVSVAPIAAKAYRMDWRHFATWCHAHGLDSLPAAPETVAVYLSALSQTHKPASLVRRTASIASNHQAAGCGSPTRSALVRKTLAGIRRSKGTAQTVKAPLVVDDLRTIVRDHLPTGLKGTRDRALLLMGFAGAFRRSELVGIDREHDEFVPEGVVVTLPCSKTDQEGAGRKVAIPYGQHPETCAVRALAAWLASVRISSRPVFRPVDRHGNIGADRLTGVGQRSTVMVRRYIRDGSLFRSNAASVVGL